MAEMKQIFDTFLEMTAELWDTSAFQWGAFGSWLFLTLILKKLYALFTKMKG